MAKLTAEDEAILAEMLEEDAKAEAMPSVNPIPTPADQKRWNEKTEDLIGD